MCAGALTEAGQALAVLAVRMAHPSPTVVRPWPRNTDREQRQEVSSEDRGAVRLEAAHLAIPAGTSTTLATGLSARKTSTESVTPGRGVRVSTLISSAGAARVPTRGRRGRSRPSMRAGPGPGPSFPPLPVRARLCAGRAAEPSPPVLGSSPFQESMRWGSAARISPAKSVTPRRAASSRSRATGSDPRRVSLSSARGILGSATCSASIALR